MRISINWLKEFVDVTLDNKELAHRLTMAGLEVEAIQTIGDDTIFEVNVTPNRADCLSHFGMSREVVAVTGAAKRDIQSKPFLTSGSCREKISIDIKDPKRCLRYTARIIEGVTIRPSPEWLKRRLEACGVRAINNVVDATNYVMLEMGHPLHAFDLREVHGNKIIVKTAGKKMKFVTLDGIERELISKDLLICDERGPVALAGVMGGQNSEIKGDTKTVLLESACFLPTAVRRTSKRLGLSSESSRRFERGVDPNKVDVALNRLTSIICEIAGGSASQDIIDIYPKNIALKRLPLRAKEIRRILGIDVQVGDVERILSVLGFGIASAGKGTFKIDVPTFRPDVYREIDLIEEVARVYGYDKVRDSMPPRASHSIARPKFSKEANSVIYALKEAGFSETVLYGFTSREKAKPFYNSEQSEISIANPMSQDHAVMTPSLFVGLLEAARLNMSYRCMDLRLFALQSVFRRAKDGGGFEEVRHIAGLISGRRAPHYWQGARDMVDFYDIKGALEQVFLALGVDLQIVRSDGFNFLSKTSSCNANSAGKSLGFVGELHPDVTALWEINHPVFAFELDFEELASIARANQPKYKEYSKFPISERDMAIVVEDRISADALKKEIRILGAALLKEVTIFDVYRGKGIENGKKSMALALEFACDGRTLTDEEVNKEFDSIVLGLNKKFAAVLRT